MKEDIYRSIIRMREREIDAIIAEKADEIKRLERENSVLLEQKTVLEEKISHMENTYSWRITKGLRKIFGFIKR